MHVSSTRHRTRSAMSYEPAITAWATKCTACCDDPHCRSTDVAGTDCGRPPATHAFRVTLQPCSPTWVTLPPTTSSMRSGSTPVRSMSEFSVNARRSVGCQPASLPFRFPIGVRTVSTMTASRISTTAAPCDSGVRRPGNLTPVSLYPRPHGEDRRGDSNASDRADWTTAPRQLGGCPLTSGGSS